MSALFSCVVFVMISMFSHLLHVILAFVLKWTRPKFGTITTIVDGVIESLLSLCSESICDFRKEFFDKNVETDPRMMFKES